MAPLKQGSWLKYCILPFGICCTLVFIVNLMLSKSGSPVTCTSSGGPVDSATWSKDGEEISPPHAVPGQVTALECPASGDATVILIRWTEPSTNAASVYGYTVQVQQYMQDGRELVPLPLDPPFYQQLKTLDTYVESGVGMFLPYSVTVTPRNAAGRGFSISIDCFTQEGVPTVSPTNVGVTRSEEDPSEIVVTWQPLTLLEARGFIEYLIQIHKVGSIKKQLLSMTVPMDEDSVTFSDLDTTADYEVSVGTRTVSSGDTGPVSDLVSVPPVIDLLSVQLVPYDLLPASISSVTAVLGTTVLGTTSTIVLIIKFLFPRIRLKINLKASMVSIGMTQREKTRLKALEN